MSTVFTQTSGLSYSRFDFGKHEIAVSFDTYANLAGIRTYQELPLSKIKIKVKNTQNTSDLSNRLRVKMSTKNTNTVWDYSESRQTI